jgi:acylphosphatase
VRFMHRAIVNGRVQNIGFRFITKTIANRKGLQGTVRNLPDGTVEIILAGSRSALEELIREVEQMLPQGCIREVSIEVHSQDSLAEGFSIRH